MSQQPLRIGLVYGSARPGRFCDTVAAWTHGELRGHGGLRIDVIDPRDRDTGVPQRSIAAADAFIVVTPEYNHGYTAELKSLIDSCNSEWHAKPVAFVSYGGISGGLRAVEQLRLVFAELHATTVRDSVSFANAGEAFDDAGRPHAADRARRSFGRMLDSLCWWAAVLRHGRRIAPYAERSAGALKSAAALKGAGPTNAESDVEHPNGERQMTALG